tara:strand:+ start:2538 stop:2735 length:198 start_codon:yes stop_codon:yes gene_type:complete
MSAKEKKKEVTKNLDALSYWLNNSNFIYDYEDFKQLLEEIDSGYKNFLFEVKKSEQLQELKNTKL